MPVRVRVRVGVRVRVRVGVGVRVRVRLSLRGRTTLTPRYLELLAKERKKSGYVPPQQTPAPGWL